MRLSEFLDSSYEPIVQKIMDRTSCLKSRCRIHYDAVLILVKEDGIMSYSRS